MNFLDITMNQYFWLLLICVLFIAIILYNQMSNEQRSTRLRQHPLIYENYANVDEQSMIITNDTLPVIIDNTIVFDNLETANKVKFKKCKESPFKNAFVGKNTICSTNGLGSLISENVKQKLPNERKHYTFVLPESEQPQVVFQGAGQAPVGSQVYYARNDTSKLMTPYSNAIWHPRCCPSDIFSSGGCLCRT